MSVENKIILDPRMVLSDRPIQVSELGAVNVNPYRTQANVANNNQIQFPVEQSAGSDSLLSNFMVLEVPIVVTFTVASGAIMCGAGVPADTVPNYGESLATCQAINLAFRSHPLMKNCQNLELKINGTPLNVSPVQDMINLLPFAYTEYQRRALASFFPCQLDTSPLLSSDGVVTDFTQSNQPLSNYVNCDGSSRASFAPDTVTGSGDNPTTTWTLSYTLYEPILLSPLSNTIGDSPYFANVESFSLNLSFVDNSLQNMFSGSLEAAGFVFGQAGLSATITPNSAYLHYSYLVPPPEAIVPTTAVYTYDNIFSLNNPLAYVANGGQCSTQSVKVSVSPKLLYLSIGRNEGIAQRPLTECDVNAQIDQITLQWGTKGTQFLSTYNAYDLWKMTMRNTGNDMPYNKWRNACNIICIRPATDCGNSIGSLEGSVNSGLQFQIKNIQYTYNNFTRVQVNPESVNWQVRLTVISSGQCVIEEGRMATNTSIITPSEAIVAVESTGLTNASAVKNASGEAGAGLFDSMKKIFHQGHQLVKKGAEFAQSDAGQNLLKKVAGSGETGGGYIRQGNYRYRN